MYAEARGAYGPERGRPTEASGHTEQVQVVAEGTVPNGLLVRTLATVELYWRLCNEGTVSWPDWTVRRVGTHAGPRLIGSAPAVAVPPCEPGGSVEVAITASAPAIPGTFAAYWQLQDGDGRTVAGPSSLLSIFLVVV